MEKKNITKQLSLQKVYYNNKFKDLSKEDIVELFGNQDTKRSEKQCKYN